MVSNVENLGALERRFNITISSDKLQSEVESRLKQLVKKTKLHGFRPGKVPLRIVTQIYGAQVQQEVLNDAVHKEFLNTIKELNLQVAGYPRIEAKSSSAGNEFHTFSATFEVYPQIFIGDLSQQTVERSNVQISDTDINKTLEMIRKQRMVYKPVERSAERGDRIKIDYQGVIDDHDFAGSKAADIPVILGEGKFLRDFEDSLVGMRVGDSKSFEVTFPEEYHNKEVAGKSAIFEVKLNNLEAPVLLDVDAEFAKSLGISDGDVGKMRESIKTDLEHEVLKRVKSKIKEQIMQLLLDTAQIEAPNALINQEVERLMESAKNNLETRVVKSKEISLTRDLFEEKAAYRVKLGLILAELVKLHALKPTREQVRAIIEEAAQGYENPEQVIKWHYASPDRLQEAESLALEENVVSWVIGKIKLIDKATTFDELMGISGNDATV